MTRVLLASSLLLALHLTAACGGKAVMDGLPGTGGAAGGTGSDGAGPVVCATPDPVGEMVDCGSWSDETGHCVLQVCDHAGQSWTADCQDQACQCLFNAEHRCTCTIDQPSGSFCNGGTPACCPSPFPK